MAESYPLLLKPVYKDYIWGGQRIIEKYQRTEPNGIYAESWEVSDRPEGNNVIQNGEFAGHTLSDLIKQYGSDLMGTDCVHCDHFPVLVKLIDSKQCLSVQVHPSDSTAPLVNGEAKTEMWYVLDAKPDAAVYAGLQPGLTQEMLMQAIKDETLADHINRIPVTPGDIIFIPGGLVHAIDKGCLLLEVQQNSNTTYRIYDWGRLGNDGQPRALHIDKAIQCIDWKLTGSPKRFPRLITDSSTHRVEELVSCDYFTLNRCTIKSKVEIAAHPNTFRVFFVENGQLTIHTQDETYTLDPGNTVLMPANIPSYALEAASRQPATVLTVMC